MIIAFLGPRGTFTEDAVYELVHKNLHIEDDSAVYREYSTQQSVIQAVALGEADYGCVPIESTISGSVAPTLDGLINYPQVRIIAEYVLPIRFVLAGMPGLMSSEISTISIYPIAQQQVTQWLECNLPQSQQIPAINNAQAAIDVQVGKAQAAITTLRAASFSGLIPLVTEIADNPLAKTRFILITNHKKGPKITGDDRTFLAFNLPNVPGSLSAAINELSVREIDLIRLESRPKLGGISNLYWFFIDFNGHIDDLIVKQAILGIKRRAPLCHFYGSWPMMEPTGRKPPTFTEEIAWLESIQQEQPSD